MCWRTSCSTISRDAACLFVQNTHVCARRGRLIACVCAGVHASGCACFPQFVEFKDVFNRVENIERLSSPEVLSELMRVLRSDFGLRFQRKALLPIFLLLLPLFILIVSLSVMNDDASRGVRTQAFERASMRHKQA